jgi:PPOX class probable F420-dependent enzyme
VSRDVERDRLHDVLRGDEKEAAVETFERFRRQHTVVLTTFRRDGTPVPTPVSFAVNTGPTKAYVTTWSTAGKAKRIGHDPHVTVAPSTFRGRVTGADVQAIAQLLTDAESDHARRLLRRKHPITNGVLVPFAHRFRRYETQHYELRPAAV